jgi:hypothetical protein
MARRAGNYLLGAEYSMETLSKLLTREVRELKHKRILYKRVTRNNQQKENKKRNKESSQYYSQEEP